MRYSRGIVLPAIPARNEAARLAHANEDGPLEVVEEPRPIGKGVCVTDADGAVPVGGLIEQRGSSSAGAREARPRPRSGRTPTHGRSTC
jgi:hypothetical protein